MKEKLKKIFNNKIFMFIFGGVLFSAVSVYAVSYFPSNQVTYDNKTSGLKSSDVQGAIDELYTTCSKATSSGKYMYYAIADYNTGNTNDSIPNSGILYRCNVDGSNCTQIKSVGSHQYINSVYATNDYLYYAIANYMRGNIYDVVPNSGILYRCNVDGNNCTQIRSVGSNQYINSVYVISDYLYYTITDYNRGNIYDDIPVYGILYRCNVNGSNCTQISSVGSFIHINAIG